MKLTPSRTSAFTLIELIICTSMLAVLAATPTLFLLRMENHRDLLESHRASSVECQEALRSWRRDVESAISIRVNPEGTRMELALPRSSGELQVAYEMRDAMLIRIQLDGSLLPRELAHNIRQLGFRPREGAWEIAWIAMYDDGARRIEWPFAGNASPLLIINPRSFVSIGEVLP